MDIHELYEEETDPARIIYPEDVTTPDLFRAYYFQRLGPDMLCNADGKISHPAITIDIDSFHRMIREEPSIWGTMFNEAHDAYNEWFFVDASSSGYIILALEIESEAPGSASLEFLARFEHELSEKFYSETVAISHSCLDLRRKWKSHPFPFYKLPHLDPDFVNSRTVNGLSACAA